MGHRVDVDTEERDDQLRDADMNYRINGHGAA